MVFRFFPTEFLKIEKKLTISFLEILSLISSITTHPENTFRSFSPGRLASTLHLHSQQLLSSAIRITLSRHEKTLRFDSDLRQRAKSNLIQISQRLNYAEEHKVSKSQNYSPWRLYLHTDKFSMFFLLINLPDALPECLFSTFLSDYVKKMNFFKFYRTRAVWKLWAFFNILMVIWEVSWLLEKKRIEKFTHYGLTLNFWLFVSLKK